MSERAPHPNADWHERDRDLVRRVLAREESATAEWTRRMLCVPSSLSSINRRFGGALPRADLADLAQDCLVAIWQKLETFEGRATLETWAYRFCFLQFMNRLRRSQPKLLGEGDVAVEGQDHCGALDAGFLEAGLTELGPPESDILRLKQYDGLSFPEIGVALGIPASTAKTRYYRGLSWLRRHLGRFAREDGS